MLCVQACLCRREPLASSACPPLPPPPPGGSSGGGVLGPGSAPRVRCWLLCIASCRGGWGTEVGDGECSALELRDVAAASIAAACDRRCQSAAAGDADAKKSAASSGSGFGGGVTGCGPLRVSGGISIHPSVRDISPLNNPRVRSERVRRLHHQGQGATATVPARVLVVLDPGVQAVHPIDPARDGRIHQLDSSLPAHAIHPI